MICWRAFPARPGAAATEEGGALWAPRQYQGDGRHDNPERYGALYLTCDAVASVVEMLAPFRGSGPVTGGMLRRLERPLVLARIDLHDDAPLIDLDDPVVLTAARLRPSVVATRRRDVTQAYAAELFDRHLEAVGLRWWSTIESRWTELTVFADRATAHLSLSGVDELSAGLPVVEEAARILGMSS